MSIFDRGRLPKPIRDDLDAYLRDSGVADRRVLAWGKGDDRYAAGLFDRLVIGVPGQWSAVRWHEIEKGGWDADTRTLRWTTTAEPRRRETIALGEPGQLPELFRERVEQTIVFAQTVTLGGAKSAVIAARRPLGQDADGVVWAITPGRGVNLGDPATAAQAQAELDRVRAEWMS
ncbi:hypothetical protein [Nigerium massiliense]|uniref:hypothetical protein n=1 Tax=Nigerium massiliense TaxID=1522317 RepID=UPI00058CC192|nr:hypothetical protein [Nigerium massiliense]